MTTANHITKLEERVYWDGQGVEVLTHIKCHTTASLLRSPRNLRLSEHFSVNPTVSISIKGVNSYSHSVTDLTITYKTNGYIDIESLMPDVQLWMEENHSISNWGRESREYNRVNGVVQLTPEWYSSPGEECKWYRLPEHIIAAYLPLKEAALTTAIGVPHGCDPWGVPLRSELLATIVDINVCKAGGSIHIYYGDDEWSYNIEFPITVQRILEAIHTNYKEARDVPFIF
jgi:hypothetical protein